MREQQIVPGLSHDPRTGGQGPRPVRHGIKCRMHSRSMASSLSGTRRPMIRLLDVAGRQSAFFQILLVIVLGGIECHRGNDLGNDRFLEAAGFLQLFL